MPGPTLFSRFFSYITKLFFNTKEKEYKNTVPPKSILIVRQHNQFGDMLASVSLFRAIKDTYPKSHLTVIVSPDNYYAITKNKYVDEYHIYDKRKIYKRRYFAEFWRVIRKGYDLAIVPATVSISFTSCLIARLSKSEYKIGPASLNGRQNLYSFFFHKKVNLDWRKYPDAHVSDFIQDIIRPLGIFTKNFASEITYDKVDKDNVKIFLKENNVNKESLLIGLHIGAGKPRNRWSMQKFCDLIDRLKDYSPTKVYITGSDSDKNEISFIKEKFPGEILYFLNRSIPELAALISISDLFITNDTGIMHVAGATHTPLVTIFGPTNPFNWAPIGQNKYFIRKSELIDDVEVDDVFKLCEKLLKDNSITENESQKISSN
ncbi:MAG: glycosyltransferase family 9 protein [Ignavibacteria bacterium]|jgi:heptosyltransferase-2